MSGYTFGRSSQQQQAPVLLPPGPGMLQGKAPAGGFAGMNGGGGGGGSVPGGGGYGYVPQGMQGIPRRRHQEAACATRPRGRPTQRRHAVCGRRDNLEKGGEGVRRQRKVAHAEGDGAGRRHEVIGASHTT